MVNGKILYLSTSRRKIENIALEMAQEYELAINRGTNPSLFILDNGQGYVRSLVGARELECKFEESLRDRRLRGVYPQFSFMGGSLQDYAETLRLRGYANGDLPGINSQNIIGYEIRRRTKRK